MSWMSGADLAEALWQTVRDEFSSPYKRQQAARRWVEVFEAKGCDTLMGTTLGDDAGTIADEECNTRWAWK